MLSTTQNGYSIPSCSTATEKGVELLSKGEKNKDKKMCCSL